MSKLPTAILTGDWIPLPPAVQTALGWREGDTIECDVTGDALVLTLKTRAPQKGKTR